MHLSLWFTFNLELNGYDKNFLKFRLQYCCCSIDFSYINNNKILQMVSEPRAFDHAWFMFMRLNVWYMFIDKGLEYLTYLCDDWIKWPQGSYLTISRSKMENCRETRSLFNATITPKTTCWFKAMTLWYLGWESGLYSKT